MQASNVYFFFVASVVFIAGLGNMAWAQGGDTRASLPEAPIPQTIPARRCFIAISRTKWIQVSRERVFVGFVALVLICFACPGYLHAQDNYEVQVYPSETIAPKTLLTELHSNYTVEGTTTKQYGMLPTQGQEHETVEFTEGLTNWSELGFYVFTEEHNGTGVQWVGDHIRPRVRIPPNWHWPVGVSISNEIGYARAAYANPTWTWQIMPIVDKTVGKWYGSVNTTMNWGIHPTSLPPGYTQPGIQYYYRNVSPHGVTFGPAATLTYQPSPLYNFGIEYYGYWGEFGNFISLHNQQQQFFPVVNLFVSPKWEINFGAGWGATASTDHLIVKVVLGRYFNWGKPRLRTAPLPPL